MSRLEKYPLYIGGGGMGGITFIVLSRIFWKGGGGGIPMCVLKISLNMILAYIMDECMIISIW